MFASRLQGSVISCALVLTACVYDLTPDVGSLIARGNEPVGDADGGSWRPPGLSSDAGVDASLDAESEVDDPDPVMSDAETPPVLGDAGPIDDADADMPDPPMHDAGPPGCSIKDSNPNKDISFKDDVWPILEICRCHSSEDDEQFGILEGGLTIDNYATLRLGGDNSGSNVVVPGNACDSIMLQKLSETPPFGNRMPNMGPYLSTAQRRILSDWIVEGAKND